MLLVSPVRFLVALFLIVAGAVIVPRVFAQEEVPVGSELRKELFELARPKVEKEAGQAVRFQGSLTRLGGWAFFTGTIVDASDEVIRLGPAESGDTAVLWRHREGEWVVVEALTGFTDVAYLDWPKKHGAPPALIFPGS